MDGVQRALLGDEITLQMDREGPLDEAAVRAVLEEAGASLVSVRAVEPSVF